MSEKFIEFDKPEFSVEKYTKELTTECIGGPELQQRKKELQSFYDHTSATLKKSVYANYKQFIDTAKEISHLESEMYQLSHILTQQRIILAAVGDEKATQNVETDDDDGSTTQVHNEIDSTQSTRAIKEIVQGFNGNLDGKTFLNEGALIELDTNDYRPIQRVFFFLFNDTLLVCKVKHDKRLEFLCEYDPKKIAVINIKDLDGVKNAINIITTEGTKMFQCITSAGKAEWIEKFESALRFDQQKRLKKSQNSAELIRTTNNKSKFEKIPQKSVINQSSIQNNESSLKSEDPYQNSASENYGPEWIQVSSEEIQTLIALRNFEDAQRLIARTQKYLTSDKCLINVKVIVTRVKLQETNLANVLIQELTNCRSRNLQVALRASKRLVKILVDMGRAREACSTLLKVCTIALRSAQREARRNNDEISEIFFCDLAQVACEFLTAFEKQPACVSALVVWCNAELQYFASQLIKHYLTKGTQLDVIAKCMDGVHKPCAKLTEIGIDLCYHLEGLLRTPIKQLIDDCKMRLLETIGRTEESWQPFNLQTKSNLKGMLLELDSLGIDMRSRTTGDTWINLTQSTVLFTRQFLQLTEYAGILAKNEMLSQNLEILLREMLLAQYALQPVMGISIDPNFVMKNKRYLIEDLLPVSIKKFCKTSGQKADILLDVQIQFNQTQPPIPKQRSVYQTDVF